MKLLQAATVCFTEALELLSKSNEAEKIKKDFTAILHVSTSLQQPQQRLIFQECIKKFGGKADEPQAKTSPLPGENEFPVTVKYSLIHSRPIEPQFR